MTVLPRMPATPHGGSSNTKVWHIYSEGGAVGSTVVEDRDPGRSSLAAESPLNGKVWGHVPVPINETQRLPGTAWKPQR